MRIVSFVLLMAIFSIGAAQQKTVHNFSVTDIQGNEFKMSDLAGKKVMIVNTASECGLTPQYEGLEALYQQYGGDKFVIIGFPANNFMNQEPGTNIEIAAFCQENYGVTFPMMSKISVKGDDQHELYKWLTSKDLNGVEDSKVKWNFQKYLINPDGTLAKVFSPRTDPQDEAIIAWIEE
ncbi:MAG: glutathione peroxidase [Salinivirgaceae bacterium]